MLPYQKVQNTRPRTRDRSRPIRKLSVISTSPEPSLKRCESPCGYQTIEKYSHSLKPRPFFFRSVCKNYKQLRDSSPLLNDSCLVVETEKNIYIYKFCELFLQPLTGNSYQIPQTTSLMHFILVDSEELNKRIFKIHKILTSDSISKYKKYKILPYSVRKIARLPP